MGFEFNTETFRNDFTFRNSERAIKRFPFPFDRDDYMYSVNMEPHVPGRPGSVFEHAFDVDEHYLAEMRDRELVLKEDPLRCQSLPHMELAGWDLLELIMESKARDYPHWFELHKNGNKWHWINKPMQIEQKFTFLDPSTLPYGPMEYITRQTQGDFTLQDQRDDNLWIEAGMVTTQADWSLDFDIGMSFHEWHAPVPLAHEKGVFDRIASIEMFEAVGEAYWDSYFECVAERLKTGGRACIQTITIDDALFERYRTGTDFIQQYIFPGGCLPSPDRFKHAAEQAGLVVETSFEFGRDYAQTLRLWRHDFLAQRDRVLALGFDERFILTWEFYLAYCEAAFEQGSTDVVQYTLRRPEQS